MVELTAGGYEIERVVAKADLGFAVPLGRAQVIGRGEGENGSISMGEVAGIVVSL